MATNKLVPLLLAVCLTVQAFVPPPVTRNTIFGEEQLEGEVFEAKNQLDTTAVSPRTYPSNPYRLPTTTRPVHYNVLWVIDIERLAFEGQVDINLVATTAGVTEIVVHFADMTVTSLTLTQGTEYVLHSYSLDSTYQFLRVQSLSGALAYNEQTPVVYTLSIGFGSTLRTDMYGIYGSWFRNNADDDDVSWMASTQFQATAARWAFPCYDEPSFKATFDITIRRPTGYRSWSCTKIESTVNSTIAGFQDDIYYTTPTMSTYLLALIVAEYDYLADGDRDTNEYTYEVIARPSAISQGQAEYAFDVGQELLAEMSDHTAIDFYSVNPNLKMTQAAIPDFGAGAMENWGLLTYREAYLLYIEGQTSSYFKQLIAYILSHEIAHMWFGNLVTCEWWDVLWLNEGFARYYQYFLTHWVEDYMGLETRFITEQIHTSLLSDSANNPHPLSNPGLGNNAQVSGMFSTLTYNKGAAVIRMTEHLLGFEVHRQGLRNYLVQRQNDVALPIHLFQALQDAGTAAGSLSEYGSDFSVIEYYQSWTEQGGHPVLNVQVNHATGDMIIFQRRFNINTGWSAVNNNYIVPITFSTASNPDFNNTKPTHIIRDSVTVINRGSIGDEWVVFNKQQTGFYRVNYDNYTWDLIILALRGNDRTLIHEYNRAQIVNDVFQFARSGLMSYTRAFNILSFLENETDYAPWVAAITGFLWLRERYLGQQYIDQLHNLFIGWSETVMSQLTYVPADGETFMTSYLRWQLAPILCRMGHQPCRTAAVQQFALLRDNGQEVPVDNRQWVYCYGLAEGTEADFLFLWQRFQTHNVYTEKITLLMTLGCTPHTSTLNTYLDAIFTDNYIIRPQDYAQALSSTVNHIDANVQLVFQYMQQNLDLISTAYTNLATPLSYVSSRLRSEEEINEFQEWATANQEALGTSYTTVYNGAESSRNSIAWSVSNQADIANYLTVGDEYVDVTTTTVAPVTDPVTDAQPPLVEPETPELPDSAVTSAVSLAVVTFAAIANFVL